MGAMNAFLRRIDLPEWRATYDGLDERWNARAAQFDTALAAVDAPVKVAHLQSIWTILYTRPSAYNWMLQYYLRAEGLALSWVGTGRLIFSLDIDDALFADILRRFAAAATRMRDDGWWEGGDGLTNKAIRRGVLKQALATRLRGK